LSFDPAHPKLGRPNTKFAAAALIPSSRTNFRLEIVMV